MWNEPDLTTYFDYSSTGTAFFAGNSEDYTQMYSASDAGLRVSPLVQMLPACCFHLWATLAYLSFVLCGTRVRVANSTYV